MGITLGNVSGMLLEPSVSVHHACEANGTVFRDCAEENTTAILSSTCQWARCHEYASRTALHKRPPEQAGRMVEAVAIHDVALARISFKGTIDATRHFSSAMAQVKTKKQRRRLEDTLLKTLAEDQVPDRPERRDLRAVKRRPRPHPVLNKPRDKFKDIPHRSCYTKKTIPKSMGETWHQSALPPLPS